MTKREKEYKINVLTAHKWNLIHRSISEKALHAD